MKFGEGQVNRGSVSISCNTVSTQGICQKHSELRQGKTPLRERHETQETEPDLDDGIQLGEEGCQASLPVRNARVTHQRHVVQISLTPEHDHKSGTQGSGGGCQASSIYLRKPRPNKQRESQVRWQAAPSSELLPHQKQP